MMTRLERLNRDSSPSQFAESSHRTARAEAAVACAKSPTLADRALVWDTLDLLKATASRVIEVVFEWQERARQRYYLESLDDHLLKDLGLSRADVLAETSKPFWRA